MDPQRRFDPGHFVSAEGGSLRLRRDHVAVDVESFLADAEAALNARRDEQSQDARLLLEEAEQAYGGPFLDEDRSDDWSSSLRNEARAAYVEVVRALATRRRARNPAATSCAFSKGIRTTRRRMSAWSPLSWRRAYATYTAQMAEIGVEPVAFGLSAA